MGRPSLREERRRELATALIRVLGTHGREGVTIASVAAEAGMAPGIVHHYFADKQALYVAGLELLIAGFRARIAPSSSDSADRLDAYADAALALGSNADVGAARAWVSLFAEGLSDPVLFARLRQMIDSEVVAIQRRSGERLGTHEASAILAFVIGALVFGAFAPRRAAGFAAPALKKLIRAL